MSDTSSHLASDEAVESNGEATAGSNGEARSNRRRATAQSMAASQKEISVSEFFAKNRHLLGFDNPRKALLTTVKEAVDNALDACEEAGILPEIWVHIERVGEDRFKVGVQDNGPGILRQQIPLIFGKLLYGSKFHRMRMSRGQQGIGISAAGMYGLLTTGKPVKIMSKVSKRSDAHYYELQIDTKRNRPEILNGKGEGVVIEPNDKGRRDIEKHEIEWIEARSRHAGHDRTGGPLPARPRQRRRLPRADGDGQPPRDAALCRSRRRALGSPAGDRHAAAGTARDQAAPLRRRVGPPGRHAQGDQDADRRPVPDPVVFAGQPFGRAEDLRRGQDRRAKQPGEVRAAGGRRPVPGDPADEDPRTGHRLPGADRRGVDPQGPAPVDPRRVLRGGHASAVGLSRQSFSDRGRAGLRGHVRRPADLARGLAGNAGGQRRPHLAAVPLVVVRWHRGRGGRQDHRRSRHAAAGFARASSNPRRLPSCTKRCGT